MSYVYLISATVVMGMAGTDATSLEDDLAVVVSPDHSMESRVKALENIALSIAADDGIKTNSADHILKTLEPVFEERRSIVLELYRIAPKGPFSEEALKKQRRDLVVPYNNYKSKLLIQMKEVSPLVSPTVRILGRLGPAGFQRLLKLLEQADKGGASMTPFHFDDALEIALFEELADIVRAGDELDEQGCRALWNSLLSEVVVLSGDRAVRQGRDARLRRTLRSIEILTASRCPAKELVPRLAALCANKQSGEALDYREVSRAAFAGLSRYGTEAAGAIPALVNALQTELAMPHTYDKSALIQAIAAIGPDANEALPLLRDAMRSSDFRNHQKEIEDAISAIRG